MRVFAQNHGFTNQVSGGSEIGLMLSSHVLNISFTPNRPLHCFFPRLVVCKGSILRENTNFLYYRTAGVLEKSAFKPREDRFPDKVSEVIFKKSVQMREIALGPVFPNKVSWTLDRFRPWPGHFQTKCPAKLELWTQRKLPGAKKNRPPSEIAVQGIVYIYHKPSSRRLYIQCSLNPEHFS